MDAVEELGNLGRLNNLCLCLDDGDGYKRHEEVLLSLLCKLSSCKLQSLRIKNRSYGSLDFMDSWSPLPSSLQKLCIYGKMHLANLPKWISPGLTSLSHVNIGLDELREEDLHTLGELPSLLNLHLYLATGPKKKLTVTGFPCLRRFVLLSLDGAYITFQKGAMPKLEKLEQSFDVSVAKAYGFYLGIEHLPCLKVIEVMLRNEGATLSESKAAAASIRNEAGAHPNHPENIILGGQAFLHDEDNEETGNVEEKSKEEGNY